MIIKALKTFSDGAISMHDGEIANVPDTKAQLFIAEGYAVEYTGEGGTIDLSAYAKKTDLNNIEGVQETPYFETLELNTVSKFIYNTSGGWNSSSDAIGASISVSEGEVFEITACYAVATAMYGLFNDNTKILTYPANVSNPTTPIRETIIVTIPNGVNELRVCSYKGALTVKKKSDGVGLTIGNSNCLFGKKWVACGDSFTAGEFNGYVDSQGQTGVNSDAYDKEMYMYKTYPWWIAKRNNMRLRILATGGEKFTYYSEEGHAFSNANDNVIMNYTRIPNDCDYITLMFGLNENNLTTEQIGTKDDSDNTTLWGAYNVVLEDILTKNPTVKIGIIITDAYLNKTYHDALINIAKYWGIPYLDLRDGEQVPMLINGKLSEHSTVAQTIRDNAFKVSNTNTHPNVKAHEYRSTIIENFLRSL